MKTRNDGYYDFDTDIEEMLAQNGMIDELFYMKDLKQRKLFIYENITPMVVTDVVRHIMQINREDDGIPTGERQPILLYITSLGGDVDAGFELIDVIQNSKTPVYTVNLGYQYSMGMLIGMAGHKRYATPNAKFLLHDGSNFVYNSGAKAQDQMKFQERVEARIRDYVIENSRISEKEYDNNLRIEWYMFADEAKKNGFTDYIIGEDCGIDEVV